MIQCITKIHFIRVQESVELLWYEQVAERIANILERKYTMKAYIRHVTKLAFIEILCQRV